MVAGLSLGVAKDSSWVVVGALMWRTTFDRRGKARMSLNVEAVTIFRVKAIPSSLPQTYKVIQLTLVFVVLGERTRYLKAFFNMTDKSRIAELASIIESRTLKLDSHFKDHNLPSPSFSVDAPPDLLLPGPLLKSQNEILEASAELQALVAGPLAHLTRLTSPTAS